MIIIIIIISWIAQGSQGSIPQSQTDKRLHKRGRLFTFVRCKSAATEEQRCRRCCSAAKGKGKSLGTPLTGQIRCRWNEKQTVAQLKYIQRPKRSREVRPKRLFFLPILCRALSPWLPGRIVHYRWGWKRPEHAPWCNSSPPRR